jgi:hypothetical protein
MNKMKIAFGVGIVLVVLTVFTASAAASNLLYFVPQNSSAEPGDEVTVKLMLNTTYNNITGFQCHVDLDTSVVNVTSGSKGSLDWDYWNWIIKNDPEYGPYLFTAGMEFGGCGPGELELGVFTLKGVNPGKSPLDFIRLQQPGETEPPHDPTKISAGATKLPINWINGTFTCAVAGEETFSKDLFESWNLVSLPLTPWDNSTSVVLGGTMVYDAVYSYIAATKQFEDVTSGTMDPGTGYFVHVTSAGTWTYNGMAYTPMSVDLQPGLNMVGWLNCTKAIGTESGDALYSIKDNYYYVAKWNATSQSFETYNPVAPDGFNDFADMDRGEGYFISMKTGDTLSESC